MVATGFGLLVEPVFAQFESPTIALFGDLLEDAWGIAVIALLLSFLSGGRLEGPPTACSWRAMVAAAGRRVRPAPVPRARRELPARARRRRRSRTRSCALFALLTRVRVPRHRGRDRRRASSARRRRGGGRCCPSVAGHLVPAVLRGRQLGELGAAGRGSPSARCWWSRRRSWPGLLRSRLARGGVADLFGELRTLRGAELQARLAKALGDPSLVVAYRQPGGRLRRRGRRRRSRVAAGGRSRRRAARRRGARLRRGARRGPGAGRGGRGGGDDRARARAAPGRSHARSRQRLVAAGDAERRRLERDLHDGAQQRLVAVAIQLRLIQADIRRDPAAAEARVTTASDELARSLEELRELARGIHPAVLDHGLAAGARRRWRRARRCRPRCRCDALGDAARGRSSSRCTSSPARRWPTSPSTRRRRRRRPARAHRRAVAIEIADDGVGGAARPAARACAACGPRRGARRPPARHEPRRRGDGRQRGAAVRVVIADDNLLMREGIASLLRRAGIEVVAEAGDADELLRAVDEHAPGRGDRRRPDAADPHRRGAAGGAGDPRRATRGTGIVILSQTVEAGHRAADPGRAPGRASATCSRTA